MPIVPQIQTPTVQAETERPVFQTTRATPAAFGGRQAQQEAIQARQLLQFAAVASDFAQISRANRDKSLVRDELNFAKSASRQFVAETRTKKGRAAIDAYAETEEELNKLRRKHMSALKSPDQKDLFANAFDPIMNAHLDRTLAFQQQARSDYEKLTWAAENQNAIEDAILDSSDDREVLNSEATIVLNTRAANQGAGKEISDKAVEDAVHALHMSVIDSIKDLDPARAMVYFQKHSNKIDPVIRDKLQKDLEDRNEGVFIRGTALELSNSGLPLEAQLAEVDKIEDPTVARGVRAAVHFRDREKKSIKQAKESKYSESQWDALFKSPLDFEIPLDLSAKDQKSMLAFKNQFIKGTNAVTDWVLFNDLMGLSPTEFQNVDLTKHLEKLAPAEFKQLVGLQRSAKQTTTKDKEKAFRVRTQYQQAQQAVKGLEDFTTQGRTSSGKKRAVRRSNKFFEQFALGLEAIDKKEQTEERVGELIKSLMAPVDFDEEWFFGGQINYRFEVPYLKTVADQNEALEDFLPENLKKFKDVQFDRETQRYFIDGDDVRDIYDRYGIYQKSYRAPISGISKAPL